MLDVDRIPLDNTYPVTDNIPFLTPMNVRMGKNEGTCDGQLGLLPTHSTIRDPYTAE
jgi:hypothetical protein